MCEIGYRVYSVEDKLSSKGLWKEGNKWKMRGRIGNVRALVLGSVYKHWRSLVCDMSVLHVSIV